MGVYIYSTSFYLWVCGKGFVCSSKRLVGKSDRPQRFEKVF